MSVVFIPSNQEFVQCADTEWPTVGGFDLDAAVVLMRGPRTKFNAYMDTLVRWSSLAGYPRMFLANWEKSDVAASFPAVSLHYIGTRDGNPPPFHLENDVTVSSATGTGTDEAPSSPTFGQTLSGTVVYLASRSTWSFYIFVTPPNAPPTAAPSPYNTISQGVAPNPFQASIQAVVDPDTGQVIPPTYSAFTAIINSLVQTVLVTDYAREVVVPGYIWGCKSVVQSQLQSS